MFKLNIETYHEFWIGMCVGAILMLAWILFSVMVFGGFL